MQQDWPQLLPRTGKEEHSFRITVQQESLQDIIKGDLKGVEKCHPLFLL